MNGGEEVLRYSSVLCPDYGLQQDNYLSQTPGGPLMSRTVVKGGGEQLGGHWSGDSI